MISQLELCNAVKAANLSVDLRYIDDLLECGNRLGYTLEQMVLIESHRQFIAAPARRTEKWRRQEWELSARIHREVYKREPNPYKTKEEEESERKALKTKLAFLAFRNAAMKE